MQAELPSTNIVTRPQQARNADGHGNPVGSRCRVFRKEDLGICQNENNSVGRTQKSKKIAKWPVPKAVRREVLRGCLGRTRVPLRDPLLNASTGRRPGKNRFTEGPS